MRRKAIRSTPSNDEKRNISEFFACASSHWGSQLKLAELTGLRQPTINGVINGTANAGSRSLLALSHITGIPIEEIISGVGVHKLRARAGDPALEQAQLNRLRAARALAELFERPLADMLALFDELGVALPVEVPATTWFDVGRSALERRAAGLELSRRLSE